MPLLSVRVTPRSAKPGVGEWKSDPAGREFLEICVAAAPADGAANDAVIRVLAKALGLARSQLSIASGQTGSSASTCRSTLTKSGAA